ncbi:neprilysin-1-like [Amblyomma americanum]
MNTALNWSYDPCEDFYGFVCHTFQGPGNAFWQLQYRIEKENREELLRTGFPPSGQNAAQKGAAMFKACIRLGSSPNNSQVESLKPFFRALDLDISNMPFDPDFDVVDRMVQLTLVYGLPAIMYLNYFNGSEFFLVMRFFPLDETWIINNYNAFRDYQLQAEFYASLINLYDPNLDSATLSTHIVEAERDVRLSLQKTNESITTTVAGLSKYTKYTVSQAHWVQMITTHSNHIYNASTKIIVLDNATDIVDLLMDTSAIYRGDSRLLVAWSVLHRLLSLSHGAEIIRASTALYPRDPDPVHAYCYNVLLSSMELAITKKYIGKYVPVSTLVSAKRMLQNIIDALKRKLEAAAWFKDPLKTLALRKTRNLRRVLGFPKQYYNKSEVEALFVDFPDVGADFVTAFLKMKQLLAYRKLTGEYTEIFNISVPNAKYDFDKNLIRVHAGLLHPPFFTLGGPAAMNYGAVGQFLGHEVMHAFDVLGITEDHRGNKITKNVTNTMVEYERRVLCLRRSYQKAESEDRARSLSHEIDSEGLADYAGLLLAFYAFFHLPASNRSARVPGVRLNALQTFFVAHCLKWCQEDKFSRVRSRKSLYWNLRSRCIVPLQNMPQFAYAFSCKASYMNPRRKCPFW